MTLTHVPERRATTVPLDCNANLLVHPKST
jgi:hypothetical protein